MEEGVINITEENFNSEVLESPVPVLIDFFAVWCAPCEIVAPILEKLAPRFQGKAKIGRLNVDEQGSIAAKYRITSIPTMMIFANGEVKDQMIGAASEDAIAQMIEKNLE
jgi:thioredoxin 1